MKRRVAWITVIVVLALLGAGTISNVVRLNATSARVSEQAANGQAALTRQCQLFPISKKLYADALDRGKITADDFDLIVSTAATACP